MKIILPSLVMILFLSELLISQPTLRDGWPQDLREVDGFYGLMDNISTIELADGRILLAASCRTRVGVWDLNSNIMLPGWPVDFAPAPPSPIVVAGPYLVDMTGDGEPEIYVCTRRFLGEGLPRMIYRYWLDGTRDEQFVLEYDTQFTNMSAPCFADLDANGLPELIFSEDLIHAVDSEGTELDEFPWSANGGRDQLFRGNVVVAVPPLVDTPVIYWPTVGMLHARRLGDQTELPNWPSTIASRDNEVSTIVLIPHENNYLIAIGCMDSIHVFRPDGSQLENFPQPITNPRNGLGPNTLSVGLVNGDQTEDIVFTLSNEFLESFDMNGVRPVGYPLEADFNNYLDPIALVRLDIPGSSSFVLQPKCSTGRENGQYQIHAFLNGNELPGFPILGECNQSVGMMSSLALIPSNDLQTLHIAFNTNMGRVVVYDWEIDLHNYIMEWALPGGDNWASRIYKPYRLTPNSPPDIAVREPADSLLEFEQHHVQQFRIAAEDPDGHPVSYLYRFDGDTVSHDSLFSIEFADTGRFVLTAVASDHHQDSSSVNWEIVVSPENSIDPENDPDKLLPEELSLTPYPNPTNGSIQVEYTLPQGTSGKLTIIDMLGREIDSKNIIHSSAGRYRTIVTEKVLPSGTYLIRITLGTNEMREERIILIR
ncbi:T9SS type A sorting domain-containing protein [bacterium]|nr:T9SS type A sorting domain-containing protein [bacterium]